MMIPWGLILTLFSVISIASARIDMKKGRYDQFASICTGTQNYVGLPIDCTGYLQCDKAMGMTNVFWIECAKGLYFNRASKTCGWPLDFKRPCPDVQVLLEDFCRNHTGTILPSPDHCAQFYDCSIRDGLPNGHPYLSECPHGTLFSFESLTCEEFGNVDCKDRFEPLSPCDYLRHQCSGPSCVPCEELIPGCEGAADGPNPYPGRMLTKFYLLCLNNKTSKVKTCDRGIFDPIQMRCTVDYISQAALGPFCEKDPGGRLDHPGICSRYYDCRGQYTNDYEKECPYPQLYSGTRSICMDFDKVDCGSKYAPKNKCEYKKYECEGSDCPICEIVHPSCVGLPDGDNAFLGKENTPEYIVCRSDRLIDTRKCFGGYNFDPLERKCLGGEFPPDTPFPNTGPVDPSTGIDPGQFKEPDTIVPTGTRSPDLPPEIVIPPDPGQFPTPTDIGGGSIDPVIQPAPTPNLESGLPDICRGKLYQLVPDPVNCARFYNCSPYAKGLPGLGNNHDECPYPQLFRRPVSQCDDFPVVKCGERYEPKAPCEYLGTNVNCVGPTCSLPCRERSPSCVGKRDGNNTFEGRELSPFYITCLNERTLSVGICRYGVYDTVMRYCTTELNSLSVEMFCSTRPTQVFPHIANCAQYYNCSEPERDPVLGKFRRECIFPDLFNIERLKCVKRDQANCRWRYEPADPCEWERNDYCADPNNCIPCAVRYRGCQQKSNGLHAVPNNNYQYLDCKDGQVTKVGTCDLNPFDPINGRCSVPAPTHNCVGLPNGQNPVPQNDFEYIICKDNGFIASKSCSPGYYDHSSQICRPRTVEADCNGREGIFLMPGSQSDYFRCVGGVLVSSGSCGTDIFNEQTGTCEKKPSIQVPEGFTCKPLPGITKQLLPLTAELYAICNGGQVIGTDTCSPGVFNGITNECLRRPCSGLANGQYSIPGNDLYFIICDAGNVAGLISCYPGMYDPSKQMCVGRQEYPTDPEVFCSKNPTAVIAYPNGCARYIDCRRRESDFGLFSHECLYPELFDTYNSTCEPYRAVKCGTRPEPKAPCDYMAQYICKNNSCVECDKIHPSCVGKRNGPQAVPGKPYLFMFCQDERTKVVTKCPETAPTFDPTIGSCGVAFDPLNPAPFCEANPTAVIPHPDNCAQYIDCRQRNTVLGNYRKECKYPQLVDAEDKSGSPCRPFTTVNCRNRLEPTAPCDYDQNHKKCMDPMNCPSCEELNPSCTNLPNGNHRFPGNPQKYIVCIQGRTIQEETCKSGVFDEVRRACILEFNYKDPEPYCRANPTALIEDIGNCARFFNCSEPNSKHGAYVSWCDYPLLYSVQSQSCVPYTEVNCGSKYVPMDACGYPDNQCAINAPDCVPCEQRLPTCTQMPDGNYTFPIRDRSGYYLTCRNQQAINRGFCEIDPAIRTCITSDIDIANPKRYCDMYPDQMVPHPKNCAQYFNCSSPAGMFGPYLFECRYPSLFSKQQRRCMRFMDVECGERYKTQSPCDYMQNQCTGPNCDPCNDRLPSCVGRLNGNNSFPGRELTEHYIVCWQNRTVAVENCDRGFFHPRARRCRRIIKSGVIRRYCAANPGVIKENPVNCAQYFDCGEESIRAKTFLRECPYPMEFASESRTCQNYTEVDCGRRPEIFTPCAYLQNRCNPLQTCIPCSKRFASCEGRPDGGNPIPGIAMSPKYVLCHRQRTILTVTCPGRSLFDPKSRTCVNEVTEAMIQQYCNYNPTSILAHPYHCAQYFDCREAIRNSYLRECKYPQLFHRRFQTCRNFTDVKCDERFEPQAPCEYLQNHCAFNATDCTPCEDRLPSCVGLRERNNPFPGRPNSEYYITCYKNRTVSVEACQISRYDIRTQQCSLKVEVDLLKRHCEANNKSIVADPINCARYYNCSDDSLVQGLDFPYHRECQYPKLFSNSNYCQFFATVNCSKRYIPMTPCDYVQNQCFGPKCKTPCEEQYPNCLGKLDGSNLYPGTDNKKFYIVCYRQRTVAVVKCTSGIYNHSTRSCDGPGRPSTRPPRRRRQRNIIGI